MRIILMALVAWLALTGCAKEEPEGVIPEGHKRQMEKAGSLEGQLNDAARKQVEQADRDSQ